MFNHLWKVFLPRRYDKNTIDSYYNLKLNLFTSVHRSRIHQGEVFNDDYEEWDKDTHKAFGPTTDKNFRFVNLF